MKYLSYGKTSYIYIDEDNNKIIKKYYYRKDSPLSEILFAKKIQTVKGYVNLDKFNQTQKLGKYKIIPYGNIKHLENEKAYIIEQAIFDGEIGKIINNLDLSEIKKIFRNITNTLLLLKKFDIYYNDFSLKNILYKKIKNKYIYVLADFDRLTEKPQNNYNKFIKNLVWKITKYLIQEKYSYEELLKITENNPKFNKYIKNLYNKEINYMKKLVPSRPMNLHILYAKNYVSEIIISKYYNELHNKIKINDNIIKFVESFNFDKIKDL